MLRLCWMTVMDDSQNSVDLGKAWESMRALTDIPNIRHQRSTQSCRACRGPGAASSQRGASGSLEPPGWVLGRPFGAEPWPLPNTAPHPGSSCTSHCFNIYCLIIYPLLPYTYFRGFQHLPSWRASGNPTPAPVQSWKEN